MPELEDDVSEAKLTTAAPAKGKKTEVKDDAMVIGVLMHAMMDYWMRGLVTKPSDTPFAEHPRVIPRSLYVAGAVADNLAADLDTLGGALALGTLVGTEVELAAGGELWGGEVDVMKDYNLAVDEHLVPLTGIADLITVLSEHQAEALRIAFLNDTVRAGLTIWDWKTMDYLGNFSRAVGGYQHHAYCYMAGPQGGNVDPGWFAAHPYPSNFIYVCVERGRGVEPKLSPPRLIRKADPDPAVDRALLSDFLHRAAARRARDFATVNLSHCNTANFGKGCYYGPRGLAICTQRPGLVTIGGL